MFDVYLHTLVSLFALGMALAFLTADARSRTSQALAVTLASTGVAIYLNVTFIEFSESPPPWSGWLALFESLALVAMLEWILRVRRTIPAAAGLNTRFADRVLRVGQVFAALYSVLAILFPETRIDYFLRAGTNPEVWRDWRFWMFAIPIDSAALAGFVAILLLLRRKPDKAEANRVIAMAIAVPFFLAGFVLPHEYAALSCVIGEIILVVGAMNYYMQQGQRGQFMARFLSPEVAKLVRDRGLGRAMQQQQLELTVVCCDLRGFTPFAAKAGSETVLGILRDYYDAVGDVVSEVGGTIKDYAGDGILVLVGAPLPVPDHAARGLQLARRMREVCMQRSQEWSVRDIHLGIGIGVASGRVTVGVIGSTTLEYTAVGAAVNLSSRLCEQACDGEILIDTQTQSLASDATLEARDPLRVKGFAEPVGLFSAPA